MAAPIPSAYTTGFNAGSPVLYVVRLNPAGAAAPLYLVNHNDITDIGLPRALHYDGSPIASGNIYGQYLAVEVRGSSVEAIGEMDFNFQMDELGGMAGRNECTIRLLNQGSLSNTLLAYDVDNSSVEVWQGYLKTTGTIAVDSDLILLFKGIVYEWEGWDRELTTLRCFDTQHLYATNIPQRIITSTNFPHAPDGLIGKPIPILIGDFETPNSDTYGTGARNSYEIGIHSLAPTVMVDTTGSGQKIYLSSEVWDNPADAIYWQDGDSPWVARIASAAISHVDGGGGVYYVLAGADTYATVYVRPIMPLTDNSADNPRYVTDSDPDNYIDVTPGGAFWVGEQVLVLGLNDFTEPGEFIGSSDSVRRISAGVDWVLKIDHSHVVGSVNVSQLLIPAGIYTGGTNLTAGAGRQVTTFNLGHGSSPAETWGAQKNYGIRIGQKQVAGWSARIYNVWIEVRSFVDLARTITIAELPRIQSSNWPGLIGRKFVLRKDVVPARGRTNLYASARGIKYKSWADDGGRSNGHNSGDIIEDAAGVIEYILRELLDVPSAEIDMDSFDTVGNTTNGTRKDWLIASSIGSEQNAFEYIRQICREFGLILYQDPHDTTGNLRWRLVTLPTTSSGVTGQVTNDILDVDDDGHPSLFQVSFTPQTNLKNDIYLHYKKNYVTDKYDKGVYLSAVAGDGVMATNLTSEAGALRGTDYTGWMELSQTKYGTASTVQYDLDFIRDTSTAEYLLKLLANWFAFRRMRVAMNLTRNLTTLTWRIGDVLQITQVLLGTNHSGVSKFMITRMNYPPVGETVPPYITIECEEIPSAITGSRT